LAEGRRLGNPALTHDQERNSRSSRFDSGLCHTGSSGYIVCVSDARRPFSYRRLRCNAGIQNATTASFSFCGVGQGLKSIAISFDKHSQTW